MLIEANTCGETITINVGPGKQHIRWLGLAVALRYQKEFFPHAFRIPQRILNSEGTLIRPRAIICEELKDGEVVTVELRNGANVSEDLYDEDANWLEDAYGAASNLRDCKFYWKVSQGQYDVSIPAKVRGDYFVSPKWAAIYPQKEYGGRFEIPVEPVELRDGVVDWVATRKCPPGTCNYKFIMEDGTEMENLPPFLRNLINRLLHGDDDAMGLMGRPDLYDDGPPTAVRVQFYSYTFDPSGKNTWSRKPLGPARVYKKSNLGPGRIVRRSPRERHWILGAAVLGCVFELCVISPLVVSYLAVFAAAFMADYELLYSASLYLFSNFIAGVTFMGLLLPLYARRKGNAVAQDYVKKQWYNLVAFAAMAFYSYNAYRSYI
eukprot:GEMP01039479.1.p1 GENE.GEMP01039479.1~~GEMP01039479.1.p1  ORF type:complete len:378 (+),score=70.12 GEMP01039479.1:232-1365(+)